MDARGASGCCWTSWFSAELSCHNKIAVSCHLKCTSTGILKNYTTAVWETAHIANVKDAWNASNHMRVEAQVCRHLDRRDIMAALHPLIYPDGTTAASRRGAGHPVRLEVTPTGPHITVTAANVVGPGDMWLPRGVHVSRGSKKIGRHLLHCMRHAVPGGFMDKVCVPCRSHSMLHDVMQYYTDHACTQICMGDAASVPTAELNHLGNAIERVTVRNGGTLFEKVRTHIDFVELKAPTVGPRSNTGGANQFSLMCRARGMDGHWSSFDTRPCLTLRGTRGSLVCWCGG